MSENPEWHPGWRGPLIAGGLTSLVGVGALLAIGQIGDTEGLTLMRSTLPTTRFLCSALITSSATILALMLTILGFGLRVERGISKSFYREVRTIAFYDTIAFVFAVLFLLVLSVPLDEGENIPHAWYDVLYYAMILLSCLLSGLVVTIVVRLFRTIDEVIVALGIGDDQHPLLIDEADRESPP